MRLDNIKAVFFDLDGTLIDVDMHRFVPAYLQKLTEQMSGLVEPEQATIAMHNAVAAMFANRDAEKTLENVLLETLRTELGLQPEQYTASLERFCENDLSCLQPLVSGHQIADLLVEASLKRGWQPVLATNPIFPRVVVDARIHWGGLDLNKFRHITAYETAHFCKPNPDFFFELLDLLGLDGSECLMIGNDMLHDLSAARAGIQTCLLTPWRIERPGVVIRPDWEGTHQELLSLMKES